MSGRRRRDRVTAVKSAASAARPAEPEDEDDAEQPPTASSRPKRNFERILSSSFTCVIVVIGGAMALLLVDPLVNFDSSRITPARRSAGAIPTRVSVPESRYRSYTGKALAYRLSAGNSVTSTLTLPLLKKTWLDRILHTEPEYYFDGYLDFQPDTTCASKARLTWRLHDKSGRTPLTHEVHFSRLNMPAGTITLTARLESPAPCTGVLRLIDPKVINDSGDGPGSGTGPVKPIPEAETRRK